MDKQERLWSIQDAAAYLNVAVKTVTRMIQRGDLPAVRVGNQWRFVPRQLAAWLDAQQQTPRGIAELLRTEPTTVPLDRLVGTDGIVPQSPAADAAGVLRELAGAVARIFPDRDPGDYAAALADREAIVSTAIGSGVAVPHLRRVEHNPAGSLRLVLLTTRRPVNFGGVPCSVFFLPVTDDLVLHLRLLQKVTYLARHDQFAEDLPLQVDAADVLRLIVQSERSPHYELA